MFLFLNIKIFSVTAHGAFFIIGLNVASWLTGSFAVFHQNIALFSTALMINIALGVAIVLLHLLGNPKVFNNDKIMKNEYFV